MCVCVCVRVEGEVLPRDGCVGVDGFFRGFLATALHVNLCNV